MSGNEAEIQLLSGVMAVQLGFAKPAQVMSATAAWTVDRETTVCDKLVSDGVLDDQKASMLQSMVKEAIRSNEGDPHMALESLGGQQILEQTFSGSIVLRPSGDIMVDATERESAKGSGPQATKEKTENKDPRYEVRSEIGKGGQARVLRVYDRHMEREVAWKEPRDKAAGSKTQSDLSRTESKRVRFLREALITAGLEHPNIVPVYELGHGDDGYPYYTMRLIRGKTLTDRLSECKDLSDRLKLLGSVWSLCNAVSYAHSHGIIHRDIKPDNVVVGKFGETVVLDWGLAKSRDEKDRRGKILQGQIEAIKDGPAAQTVEGSALGTPSYMSPEQAEGLIDEIDERSDVWGLGAVLYRVLTDKPPHSGVTPFEIVGKAIKEDPKPVAEICPDAPPELAAIAEKALHRKKSKRYKSAQDLAKDLEAFMGGQRVSAYDYGSWELVKRFASKHRTVLVSATVVLAVIIVSLVLLAVAYKNEASALDREQESRLLAHLRLAQAYDSQARTLMIRQKILSARIYAAASLLYNPVNPKGPSWTPGYSDAHPEAWRVLVSAGSLLDQTADRPVISLEKVLNAGGQVKSMSLSPDGKHLAAVGMQKGIFVWNTTDFNQEWFTHGHDFYTRTVDLFPDGEKVLSIGYKPSIAIWKIGQDKPLEKKFLPPGDIKRAALSPDGKLIASPDEKYFVSLFDSKSLELIRRFKAHDGYIWRLVFTHDGKQLLTSAEDRTVRMWRVSDGHEIWRAKGHTGRVYALALSPDGKKVASASTDRTLRLWDAKTGEAQVVIEDPADGFYGAAWSADSMNIAAGGLDTVVSIWDSETEVRRISVEGHREPIEDILFSPDGKQMFSSSDDGTVRVWNLGKNTASRYLKERATIYTIRTSPDGKTILSGCADGQMYRWDLPENAHTEPSHKKIFAFGSAISSIRFSQNAQFIAAVAGTKLKIWNSSGTEEIRSFEYSKGRLKTIAFSPKGKFIAAGSSAKSVLIWSLSSGKRVKTLNDIGTYVTGLAYSPDGKQLYVSGGTPDIGIWDTRTWKKIDSLRAHSMPVNWLSMIPGGKDMASADRDGLVIVWDIAEGKPAFKLKEQKAPVDYMSVSNDGRWLATASADDTLRVWNLSKRKLISSRYLQNGPGPLVFLDNKLRLASGSDREIEIFQVHTSVADKDPRLLLESTQKDAGLRLEGFGLVDASDAR